MKFLARFWFAAYVAAAALSASAQTPTTLAEVLKGKVVPLEYTLEALPDTFFVLDMDTSGQGTATDLMSMMFGTLFQTMGGGLEKGPATYFTKYWTDGTEVKIHDEIYLVTYSAISTLDLQAMMQSGKEPTPEQLRAPLPKSLQMKLVNVKTITKLAPVVGMTKKKAIEMHAAQEKARDIPIAPTAQDAQATEMSNMKMVATAALMYAGDYDDVFPKANSTAEFFALLEPYEQERLKPISLNPAGGRILCNINLAGVELSSISTPSRTVLLYSERPWPNGSRIVAFADASCVIVSNADWPQIQESLKEKFRRPGSVGHRTRSR